VLEPNQITRLNRILTAPCVQVQRERVFRKEAEALAAEKKAAHAYAMKLQKEVRAMRHLV
jgi:hypothetical protein